MKPFLINLSMTISDSNFNLKWTWSTQKKTNNAGLMDGCIHTNTDDRGSRIRCDSSQPSHGSLEVSCCLPLPSLSFALILSLKKRWVGRRPLSEASGSQRPGQENRRFTSHNFRVGGLLSALLDTWVVFSSFMTKVLQVHPKGVTSNELDPTQLFLLK